MEFERDELFDEAARIVVTSRQASISFLQRRLRIGFSRAARLIDMMEADGLVSSGAGGKAREVLVAPTYFDEVDGRLRWHGAEPMKILSFSRSSSPAPPRRTPLTRTLVAALAAGLALALLLPARRRGAGSDAIRARARSGPVAPPRRTDARHRSRRCGAPLPSARRSHVAIHRAATRTTRCGTPVRSPSRRFASTGRRSIASEGQRLLSRLVSRISLELASPRRP